MHMSLLPDLYCIVCHMSLGSEHAKDLRAEVQFDMAFGAWQPEPFDACPKCGYPNIFSGLEVQEFHTRAVKYMNERFAGMKVYSSEGSAYIQWITMKQVAVTELGKLVVYTYPEFRERYHKEG